MAQRTGVVIYTISTASVGHDHPKKIAGATAPEISPHRRDKSCKALPKKRGAPSIRITWMIWIIVQDNRRRLRNQYRSPTTPRTSANGKYPDQTGSAKFNAIKCGAPRYLRPPDGVGPVMLQPQTRVGSPQRRDNFGAEKKLFLRIYCGNRGRNASDST